MSAKSQGIGQDIVHILYHRRANGIVQVAFFVCYFAAYGLVDESLLDGLDAGNEFHSACSSQQMPDHGFGGVDHHVLGCFSKGDLDRSGLVQVIVMGTGSVGVDIVYLGRLYLAFYYG